MTILFYRSELPEGTKMLADMKKEGTVINYTKISEDNDKGIEMYSVECKQDHIAYLIGRRHESIKRNKKR